MSVPFAAAAAIDHLASDTITITRRPGAYGSDGAWTEDTPSQVTAAAQVQPAEGRTLQRLPEGRRGREAIRIFTRTELRLDDAEAGRKADLVTWNGSTFEVSHVKPWGGAYYDALATRSEP